MKEQYGVNQFGKVSQLSLTAAARDGRTYLEDVYFTAPYKMMTPFEKEDGGIQVMPLCASAGIMKGDVQRFEYNVGQDADMEVLSQSFEKIHKMDGGCARREVTAKVESGAKLYFLQAFTDRESVPYGNLHAPSREKLERCAKIAKPFVTEIRLRGID